MPSLPDATRTSSAGRTNFAPGGCLPGVAERAVRLRAFVTTGLAEKALHGATQVMGKAVEECRGRRAGPG